MDARLWTCLLVLAGGACGKSRAPGLDEYGELACDPVDASVTCPSDAGTYASVQPILARACVPCHDGTSPDGPWPLLTYIDVANWASVVKDTILDCSMPPTDAGVPYPISNAERSAIVQWVICGAPR